jgi:hypothetical protein
MIIVALFAEAETTLIEALRLPIVWSTRGIRQIMSMIRTTQRRMSRHMEGLTKTGPVVENLAPQLELDRITRSSLPVLARAVGETLVHELPMEAAAA